jgi:hypothetical protein
MKRLKFKKPFNGFGNALNLIPESYREEGKIFEMTDGVETFRVKWEDGKANIINEELDRLKLLMEYNSSSTLGLVQGEDRIEEESVFNKSLITEGDFAGMPIHTADSAWAQYKADLAKDNEKLKKKVKPTDDYGDEDWEKESRAQQYGIQGENEEVEEGCKKTNEEEVSEEKPSAGMTKKEKSSVVKKAKKGEDIGKPGKGFEKVEKAAKKSGAKDPEAVAAAAMWKQQAKK